MRSQPLRNTSRRAVIDRSPLNDMMLRGFSQPVAAEPVHNFPVIHDPVKVKLVKDFLDAKAAAAKLKELQAEVMMLLGDSPKAMVGPYVLAVSPVKGSPDRVITPDMVGETIKGRAAGQRLTVV